MLAALGDATPAAAALLHSHPEWIVRLWWEQLGPEGARALLARDNEPAEAAVRVNALVAEPGDVAARLPVPSRPAEGIPEGLVLEAPFDLHGSELWAEGALMGQSRASMLVARVLDPQPGERVLDLCAAPGGKTTHLAALAGNDAGIVAVERHAGRAAALRANCERLRATSVTRGRRRCRAAAGRRALRPRAGRPAVLGPGNAAGTPGRSLADASEGVWRSWRPARLASSTPGWTRWAPAACWSTPPARSPRARTSARSPPLSPSHPDVVADDLSRDWPLWQHPDVPSYLQTLPHRDRTDGFFIARLRRSHERVGAHRPGARSAPIAASPGCAPPTCRAATAASTACTASSWSRSAPTAASTRRSCGCRPTRRS